jgi:dipeptidyl aminopeptidase/acylaminoacyl peptidase
MADDTWKRRFSAPRIDEVRWAGVAPDRLGVVSTESGSSQAWAWDLASGERRQASSGGVGAEEVHVMPDGEAIVWWLDPLGDERGRWMVTPFHGGEATPLLPGSPDAWMAGLSLVPGAVAAGFSTDDDYVIVLARNGGPARPVYRHQRPAGVGCAWPQGAGGLSSDGTLLCFRHAEQSDISHPALRILDLASGAPVGELSDEGRSISPVAWSPIPGDERLVIVRELGDRLRPWLWDLRSGALAELTVDLPGDLARAWWYPDGTALLLHHDHEARNSLHRLDLVGGALSEIAPARGTIGEAGVRPDGEVWFRTEDGVHPPAWRDRRGAQVLTLPGEAAPAGRPWEAVWFDNPSGQAIQAWLLRPDGDGPYPIVVSIHGGPDYHDTDLFSPTALAFADHGFAVLSVNYRGSTGYGAAFRESLRGDIGFPESVDLIAGLDHLVARGIVDPEQVLLEGWSWGGYLATLNAGLNPERWRGVVAGVPIGDYVAAHYECAPALRAWDVATLGGSPMDLPALYHERNPMTYVDLVRAPVLLIAGEHDSRCPLGQVMVYAHALRRRGHPVELHLYPGGHHANDVAEQIRQAALAIEFFGRCLADRTAIESMIR